MLEAQCQQCIYKWRDGCIHLPYSLKMLSYVYWIDWIAKHLLTTACDPSILICVISFFILLFAYSWSPVYLHATDSKGIIAKKQYKLIRVLLWNVRILLHSLVVGMCNLFNGLAASRGALWSIAKWCAIIQQTNSPFQSLNHVCRI